jgi:hypothetical protein
MKWKATNTIAHVSSLDLIQFQAGLREVLLTISVREVFFLPRSSYVLQSTLADCNGAESPLSHPLRITAQHLLAAVHME